MIQAAMTFGAGVLAGQGLHNCTDELPNCTLRGPGENEESAFKLAVHVHGASVPELWEPGILTRPRPQLQAFLGQSQKETEVADFVGNTTAGEVIATDFRGGNAISGQANTNFSDSKALLKILDCAWRFGDTLTFAARLGDILCGGLQLRLCARSDICLGRLQVQLPHTHDLGEAVLDLRHHILPACEPNWVINGSSGFGGSGQPAWGTPSLAVPFTHARNSLRSGVSEMSVVAQVVLSFSVNVNPNSLLHEAGKAERPFLERCMQVPVPKCLPDCSRQVGEATGPIVVQVCKSAT